MNQSDLAHYRYYPIHAWPEIEDITVEEVPSDQFDWNHQNGLAWGVTFVELGQAINAFGARLIHRRTGPEYLWDRKGWLNPFNPSEDIDLAKWIEQCHKLLNWGKISDLGRADSHILKITKHGKSNGRFVNLIRCVTNGGYVYQTAFRTES
jgi:hypothetical protein